MSKAPELLKALEIPLHGRHMIEASAGTGKTYNITRIYVRLLVEKGLSVKQILVMTFTEAATEEIKDRLASFIDELLQNFDTNPCEFSRELKLLMGGEVMFSRLSLAQLELDLSAIYTINGFCQRIIGRFGLSMSLPQNAELLPDFQKINLAHVTDALRALRASGEDYALLQTESFHDPVNFVKHFGALIGSREEIKVLDTSTFLKELATQFNSLWERNEFMRHSIKRSMIDEKLVLYRGVKTGGEKKIEPDINEALEWLSKPKLIPTDSLETFVNRWLGLEGCNKEDSKEAEGELINPAFKRIFSSSRIKNYIAAGMSEQSPLLINAENLLNEIKTPKGLAKTKTELSNSLRRAPLYKLVYQLIRNVNIKISEHKQVHGVIGFNDQIEGVANAMQHSGEALIESLQEEYPAALVDEFQDTDEYQYSILEHLFPKDSQDRLLLMIGDPKQAIYSFRGGDIYTYLRARKASDFWWEMKINYRSTSEVVHCYNRLFHGAPLKEEPKCLFDENIVYPLVDAAPETANKISLIDTESSIGLSAFTFVCANALLPDNPQELETTLTATSKDTQTDEIVTWCANEAKRLLSEVFIKNDGKQGLVQSEDIAILVRSKSQATIVKQVFSEHGLPTVFLGEKTPLFETAQALHILWFLQAVQQPTRENIRQAITTGLVDFDNSSSILSATLLLDDGHPSWESVFNSLANYRIIWLKKGVYALLQSVIQKAVVQNKESERQLTNYMHIAELLANASITNNSALLLIHWLHKQITNVNQSSAHELRLESDQKLIKIVTQHKSKGLEYPIVFLPFSNHLFSPPSPHTSAFHNENLDRVTQLGATSSDLRRVEKEAFAEDMRLLYVSLTRPVLRCYLGVFTLASSNKSALMRAMDLSVNNKECDDVGEYVYDQIKKCLSDISSSIFVTMADNLLPLSRGIPEQGSQEQNLKPFVGHIDKAWQVTSFSKLSKRFLGSIDNEFTQNPNENTSLSFSRDEEGDFGIEPSVNGDVSSSIVKQALKSYQFQFMKGPDAGNLLHDILELVDFESANINDVLVSLNVTTINNKEINNAELTLWIERILSSPFSGLDNFSLLELKTEQTLKESEFYFPIYKANSQALLTIVNTYRQQLCRHFSIAQPKAFAIENHTLQGAMHGFIDLIFEWEGKFYVADYKSNYLGDNILDYQASNLAEDILKHQYDIQYLIYSLALHRYLTGFLPDYQYELHFGGVYYLYLRGMGDPNNKQTGFFYDKIDGQIIWQLDKLFDSIEDDTGIHRPVNNPKELN